VINLSSVSTTPAITENSRQGLITGVVDTGDKFFASVVDTAEQLVVDTGDKFFAGVVDTAEQLIANIAANFGKNSKLP
jgi:hypothetical protein